MNTSFFFQLQKKMLNEQCEYAMMIKPQGDA